MFMLYVYRSSQVVLAVRRLSAHVGDESHVGSISESGRTAGRGHGNPLQYSCLENPWSAEPGGLQSMGSQRVGHDRSNLACMYMHMYIHTRLYDTKTA